MINGLIATVNIKYSPLLDILEYDQESKNSWDFHRNRERLCIKVKNESNDEYLYKYVKRLNMYSTYSPIQQLEKNCNALKENIRTDLNISMENLNIIIMNISYDMTYYINFKNDLEPKYSKSKIKKILSKIYTVIDLQNIYDEYYSPLREKLDLNF